MNPVEAPTTRRTLEHSHANTGASLARSQPERQSGTRTIVPWKHSPQHGLATAIVLLLIALLPGMARAQTIIYVNAAAAPGGNGASWGTAFNNLQAALDVAAIENLNGRSSQIWVAQGTYRPTRERVPGMPRSAVFEPVSRTAVYGGFQGTETSLASRRIDQFFTILSGDRTVPDQPNWINRDDNTFGVVLVGTQVTEFRLDGFTIRGAYNPAIENGNGVSLVGNGVVANCSIEDNWTWFAGGGGVFGGDWLVQNCRFVGNYSGGSGGGARTLGDGTTRFENCVFYLNSAAVKSGALEVSYDPAFAINCVFVANSAGDNTLINAGLENGSLTVDNSILHANAASLLSGPVSVRSSLHAAGAGASGNIGGDPLFVNPGALDFRLQALSPCIDRGSNTALSALTPVDLLGRRRIHDGDLNGTALVDMGATEFGAPQYSPVLYVRKAASGTNDGSSWTDAFTELRSALSFLQSQPAWMYSSVWLARGTYTPAAPGGSRSASFNLQNNFAIYGGFFGTEATLAQRPPLPTTAADALDPTKATILSGDLNGDDVGDVNRSENVYHVVLAVGATGISVEGCTIASGLADGANSGSVIDDYGGGAQFLNASGAIRGCVFVRCGASGYGGALALIYNSRVDVERVMFVENGTISGGGGAVMVQLNPGGAARITGSHFEFNRAVAGQGGAIRVFASGDSTTIASSVFKWNMAGSDGGAIASDFPTSLSIVNSRILGNVAARGGGAFLSSSGGSVRIANSEFVGNRALQIGAAAIQFGGLGGDSRLVNSTISQNRGSVAGTGAVHITSASPPLSITNCILRANNDGSESGQVTWIGGAASLQYCTVNGWTGGLSGTGCFGDDPLLARLPDPGTDALWGTIDDDFGDLRPLPGSTAIDSGSALAVPVDASDLDGDGNITEALPLDLAGFPRFVDDPASPNTGVGSPPVDRGAYESQVNCLTCPGPREWRSPIGGNWDFPSNWTPSVPNQTHDVLFNLDGAFGVDFTPAPVGSSTRAVRTLTVADGAISFDLNQTTLSATELLDTSLVVGTKPSDSTSLTITDGTLNAVNVQIAQVPTSPAVTQSLSIGAGGRLIAERSLVVGFQGAGRMNISGGGRVTSRDATIGDQAGSSGYVSVSGLGSTWDIPFFCIIDNGELNVSNQGRVNVGIGIPFTGIFILNDGRVSGDGIINGNVVNFGRIAPGNSPGTLTITGGYAQVGQIQDLGAFSGRLDMEVAGAGAAQYDRLVISGGDVTLGGGLFVSFAGGFQPAPTDTFELLSSGAGAIERQFDVIFFPALTAPPVLGKFLRASYTGLRGPGNGVNVNVANLPVNAGFNPPQSTPLASAPEGAAIGDLNRDGVPDLAIALPNGAATGSIALLINNGSGVFTTTQISALGVDPRAVAIADINGANGNDLIIANRGSDSIIVLRQQSAAGNFADPTPITINLPAGAAPIAVAARDMDISAVGNAGPDLAVANEGAGGGGNTGSVAFIRNSGGTNPFPTSPTVRPMSPGVRPTGIRPMNPDSDKDLDCAVAGQDASGAGSVTLFANINATGIFGPPASIPSAIVSVGAGPVEITSGVLSPNGAGQVGAPSFEDIVTVNRLGQSVSVLRNTRAFDELTLGQAGAETGLAPAVDYTIPRTAPNVPSDPRSITLSDIDNDADLDIAAIASNSTTLRVIKVLRNDSTTQTLPGNVVVRQVAFAQIDDRISGDCPRQVLAGDVTADGRADLVTVNTTCDRGLGNTVSLNRNNLPPLLLSLGACCAPEASGGLCEIATVGECVNSGRTYRGDLTACTPNPCPQPPGACCRGSTCALLSSTACAASGPMARYVAPGASCNPPGNSRTPCCKADFNQSGMLGVQDIFDYLAAWFTGDFTLANINNDAVLSIQDLFDFLAAWFGGC